MRRKSLLIFTAASLLACSLAVPAWSATNSSSSDQKMPIRIQSDNGTFNQKSDVSTYTGHVVLTRGGLTLTGRKLVVTDLKHRGEVKAVLTGDPAHIDKQPDSQSKESITGHADSITYSNADSMLTLRGDAMLVRAGGDTITSPVITRNIKTGETEAKGDTHSGQRVHITIQPAQNTAASDGSNSK